MTPMDENDADVPKTTQDLVTDNAPPAAAGEPDAPPAAAGEPEPKWFTARLGEITRARREEERARIAAEEQAAYWKGLAEGKGAIAKDDGELKREAFDDDESYLEAVADRKITERLHHERIALTQELENRRLNGVFFDRCDEARTRYKDFDAVALGDHWSPTGPMVQVLRTSDKGADVAYYLGQHVEEAGKIARMSPWQQALELGKIEERLSVAGARQATGPAPISPLRSSDGTFVKNPENMTDAEWYESQRKAKGRR